MRFLHGVTTYLLTRDFEWKESDSVPRDIFGLVVLSAVLSAYDDLVCIDELLYLHFARPELGEQACVSTSEVKTLTRISMPNTSPHGYRSTVSDMQRARHHDETWTDRRGDSVKRRKQYFQVFPPSNDSSTRSTRSPPPPYA